MKRVEFVGELYKIRSLWSRGRVKSKDAVEQTIKLALLNIPQEPYPDNEDAALDMVEDLNQHFELLCRSRR